MAAHQVDATLFHPHVAVPSGETLSFEGASTRSCVSRKALLTTGLANMPWPELGQKQPPNDVRDNGSSPRNATETRRSTRPPKRSPPPRRPGNSGIRIRRQLPDPGIKLPSARLFAGAPLTALDTSPKM
jgi:hypothetical protein